MRTTAPPTARLTTSPTFGGGAVSLVDACEPRGEAWSARSACSINVGRDDREPRRIVRRKSSERWSRWGAASTASGREPDAALGAAGLHDRASGAGAHAHAEAVGLGPLAVVGLKGALHVRAPVGQRYACRAGEARAGHAGRGTGRLTSTARSRQNRSWAGKLSLGGYVTADQPVKPRTRGGCVPRSVPSLMLQKSLWTTRCGSALDHGSVTALPRPREDVAALDLSTTHSLRRRDSTNTCFSSMTHQSRWSLVSSTLSPGCG